MPEFLVTYNIVETKPDPHAAFIWHALEEGLTYVHQGTDDVLRRLPNTTLWGVFAEPIDVYNALRKAAAAAAEDLNLGGVTISKTFVTMKFDWIIASDVRKYPDRRWSHRTSFLTCAAHQRNDPFFRY